MVSEAERDEHIIRLSAEEEAVLQRARDGAELPPDVRLERYGRRSQQQILDDLNSNWDVTRALLRSNAKKDVQIEALKKNVRKYKRVSNVISGVISTVITGIGLGLIKLYFELHK